MLDYDQISLETHTPPPDYSAEVTDTLEGDDDRTLVHFVTVLKTHHFPLIKSNFVEMHTVMVTTGSERRAGCTCIYHSATDKMCSHILAALLRIFETGRPRCSAVPLALREAQLLLFDPATRCKLQFLAKRYADPNWHKHLCESIANSLCE